MFEGSQNGLVDLYAPILGSSTGLNILSGPLKWPKMGLRKGQKMAKNGQKSIFWKLFRIIPQDPESRLGPPRDPKNAKFGSQDAQIARYSKHEIW